MSLGYGVVQLDVTIVNTALNASLVISAGVLLTAAVAILWGASTNLPRIR
jgi:sugar phosphate permease